MKNYCAVIFDLDGVLCVTDRYHYNAWKKLADELNIYFDEKINERLRGISRMQSLEIILERSDKKYDDAEKLRLAAKKNDYYIRQLEQMSEKDLSGEVGITIFNLKNAGYKLAIGSSSKNAKYILGKLGITNLFDAVSDGSCISKSKPDPEVFLTAASMLNLKPSDCLVVEDAYAGAEAAFRGGFDCAGLGDACFNNGITYKLNKITDLLSVLKV